MSLSVPSVTTSLERIERTAASSLQMLLKHVPYTSADVRLSLMESECAVVANFDVMHAGERRLMRSKTNTVGGRDIHPLREAVVAGMQWAAEQAEYLDSLRQGMRDLVDQ